MNEILTGTVCLGILAAAVFLGAALLAWVADLPAAADWVGNDDE